jgi:asparagine synthase (glutamine-hydrolysing)
LSEDKRYFLGVKPLFYAFVPSGFAFASEMKALFPLQPQVRPNLPLVKDSRRIIDYENTEECVIEGIKRFPAGHCGWVKDGKLTLWRGWCTSEHLMEVPESYEEQVEQFRSLFLDACRLRMRSDVPIGTSLSGGLDSSSVISAIAHIGQTDNSLSISKDWQHAIVACFPETPLDESSYAKQVTDHLGIEATFVEIDTLKRSDRLYDYFYLLENIYLTSPIPFMMIYEALKSNGVKVSLDGHTATELLRLFKVIKGTR